MSHSESTGLHGNLTYTIFNNYTVIDIETTGLVYNSDKIIELSAIKVINGKCVSEYSTLVNPGVQIPQSIIDKTGITDEMVKDFPTIEIILPDFLDYVGDTNIVGHNVSFDLNFINYNCTLYNFDAIMSNYCDTRWISHYEIPDAPNYRLETIAKILNIEQTTAHRALADCHTTFECYEKIKQIQYTTMPKRRTFNHDTYQYESDIKIDTINPLKHDIYFQDITGLKICLTGEFNTGTRNEIINILEERGAIIKTSVSKNLNILLVGSLGSDLYKGGQHGTKETKALELISKGAEINIINENDFFKTAEI